jgi:hypothetical protein
VNEPVWVEHVAEELRHGVQLCSRCGAVICDYNGAVSLGGGPPRGFEPGRLFRLSNQGAELTTTSRPRGAVVQCSLGIQ